MIKLSQRDPQWGDLKLGESNLTINRWGCTTTALSMLSDYFQSYFNPGELATKILKYTKDGLIIWQSVNNIRHMAFEKRLYGRNDSEILKSLKDPTKAVILEVDGKHWVTAVRKSLVGKSYKVADPWFGDICTVPGRYKKITGSSHF